MLRQFLVVLLVVGVGAFVPRALTESATTTRVQPPKLPTHGFVPIETRRIHEGHYWMKNNNNKTDNDQGSTVGFFDNFKDKPAMWVVFPFLLLFGVDILLNLAVLVKRSLDYFVLGQAPSTETWW